MVGTFCGLVPFEAWDQNVGTFLGWDVLGAWDVF
jgi:hypothetical protein